MKNWRGLSIGIGELCDDTVRQNLNDFYNTNSPRKEVQGMIKACQHGIGIVRNRYEEGRYNVGDLIFAGELLVEIINVLKPLLSNDEIFKLGKIAFGIGYDYDTYNAIYN